MNITGKTFATKKDEIAYMVANKSAIIELKKSVIKNTDGVVIGFTDSSDQNNVIKELTTSTKDDTADVIKRTIVGNTYNYLDSHMDVHLDGTFTKSIKEKQGRIHHLHDHIHRMTAKVGKFTDVYEKEVKWRDLGFDLKGTTTALMADSDIKKVLNADIFEQYKSGEVDQHSVGMYYVKIEFAVDDEDYEAENKVWKAYIDKIGNREKAEERGYFWAVKEAKLIEISAVLMGSNDLTPTVEAKNIEPSADTQNKGAGESHSNDSERDSDDTYIYFL